MARTKETPPAVRRGAKVGGKNYIIQSKVVRRVCRGLNWKFVPRNEVEERMFADFLEQIGHIATEYARKVARRAVNSIGRKD